MKQPTTLQEATQQVRIQERANRLFADGYTVRQTDDVEFIITNEEGTRYEVNTLWETCSCPFFKQNEYCKHYLGYEKLLAEQKACEEAQVAELEAEYELRQGAENFTFGCDPYFGIDYRYVL